MTSVSCLWCWWPVYAVLIAGAAALASIVLYHMIRDWLRTRRKNKDGDRKRDGSV